MEVALDPSRWSDLQESSQSVAGPSRKRESGEVVGTGDPDSQSPIDTWVCPMVQMMPFSIDVDHKLTEMFLRRASAGSRIHLASGYFNLTENYQDVIVKQSSADYDILTAAPLVSIYVK